MGRFSEYVHVLFPSFIMMDLTGVCFDLHGHQALISRRHLEFSPRKILGHDVLRSLRYPLPVARTRQQKENFAINDYFSLIIQSNGRKRQVSHHILTMSIHLKHSSWSLGEYNHDWGPSQTQRSNGRSQPWPQMIVTNWFWPKHYRRVLLPASAHTFFVAPRYWSSYDAEPLGLLLQ